MLFTSRSSLIVAPLTALPKSPGTQDPKSETCGIDARVEIVADKTVLTGATFSRGVL